MVFLILLVLIFSQKVQVLMKKVEIDHSQACHYPDITHADFVAALSQLDTYVDISEEDLLRIYETACRRRHPALQDRDRDSSP